MPNRKLLAPNLLDEIDVIIPVLEKDLTILPYCLSGIRKNVKNIIRNIYIVSPQNDLIKKFAIENDIKYVNENFVLGYGVENINFITHDGVDRGGWIFQQLLKLSGNIGNSRYFLVIDSDHVLLQPHVFITKEDKMVFYQSYEYHKPYYKFIRNIFKDMPLSWFSYVSHKMIFDKNELVKLHCLIENNCSTGDSWDQIILSFLDFKENSCFSEFELYGNFIDKSQKINLPWRQKALKRVNLASYLELKIKYKKYMSVTFPSYL